MQQRNYIDYTAATSYSSFYASWRRQVYLLGNYAVGTAYIVGHGGRMKYDAGSTVVAAAAIPAYSTNYSVVSTLSVRMLLTRYTRTSNAITYTMLSAAHSESVFLFSSLVHTKWPRLPRGLVGAPVANRE